VEAQSNSSSSPARSSRAAHTKNDTPVAYGVRFGRYLYGGARISYSFHQHWFQAQIRSESTGIVKRI
jgi:hypothetical protein